jgi:hypothetical protein
VDNNAWGTLRPALLATYYSGDKMKKHEMGEICGTYGGQERPIQDFGWETWGKETTSKT